MKKPNKTSADSEKRNPQEESGSSQIVNQIPVANVENSLASNRAVWFGSRMWLVAIASLIIAVGLVWWTLPQSGVAIYIHFPEGHGLQSEDVVSFKGIDVGIVKDVKLNPSLSGVDVEVHLKPFASKLAVEGTRFWVVRPELSLSGISGLETAVGHKYIGLLPGSEDGLRKYYFEGLSDIPADGKAEPGFEIIIRGDERYSVSAGSPVTCRGVEVGRILSVGLSRNARFVDVRARIYQRYRALVNSESKFWASSGVDFDFSIGGGVKLKAESLETIARGGVSMLTISDKGAPVSVGQVFKLYESPEDKWFVAAANVRINDIELGGAVPLEISWQQKGLFGNSKQERTFGGIPVRENGKTRLLVPLDMLAVPEKAVDDSLALTIIGQKDVLATQSQIENASEQTTGGGRFAWLDIDAQKGLRWLEPGKDFRESESLEDSLAVRATGKPDAFTFLHYSIDKDLLFVDPDSGNLVLRSFDGDKSIWHGAPIQSVADGKIIGALLTDDKRTVVVGVQNLK